MEQITYNPKTDDENEIIDRIMEQAKTVDGKRRNRILYRGDARDLLKLISEHPEARTVRSYSRDGFVANSYKYQSHITRATGTRKDDGTWSIVVDTGSANRSHGEGALLTVDNRGVE